MGSVGVKEQPILDSYGRPYSNPTEEHSSALRRFSGTIRGVDEIQRKFYHLPTEPVKMIKIGEWSGGIGTWVFADGTHADLQFSRDRHGNFYLEAADEFPAGRYYNG